MKLVSTKQVELPKRLRHVTCPARWDPAIVINGVTTPINRVIAPVTHLFIGVTTPLVAGGGAPCSMAVISAVYHLSTFIGSSCHVGLQ